jgi:hypothetical protein
VQHVYRGKGERDVKKRKDINGKLHVKKYQLCKGDNKDEKDLLGVNIDLTSGMNHVIFETLFCLLTYLNF